MLISEIIGEVLSDVGEDSGDTDLIAKVLIFAKGALRRFPLFCRSRLLMDTSYATLKAGVNYLTTPTGFIEEIAIYYLVDGKKNYIDKATESEFGDAQNTQLTGNPSYYRIVGNVIEFDKSAAEDLVIYVEHFKEVDNVALADDFFGSTDILEILKDGMKATYYSDYQEDVAKGKEKLALFKVGLDTLDSKFMVKELGTHVTEA